MYFRSMRRTAQEVSLSDYIDTGADGAPLEIMDVVGEDTDLMERLSTLETNAALHRAIAENLTEQERLVIRLRYGLDGRPPQKQREVALTTGISRSYVSRIEKRALEKLRQTLDGTEL